MRFSFGSYEVLGTLQNFSCFLIENQQIKILNLLLALYEGSKF